MPLPVLRTAGGPRLGTPKLRAAYLRRKSSIRCRSQLFHLGIGGERAGAIDVFEIDHGAVAVLQSDFADESAQRRLMVAGAENKRPEGAVDLEAAESVNELFGVGRAGP